MAVCKHLFFNPSAAGDHAVSGTGLQVAVERRYRCFGYVCEAWLLGIHLPDYLTVTGSRSTIGADLLVPLFTVVVITAQVPHIHLVLDFLVQYGVFDEQGDISYNIANLEGSVLFVLDQLAVPEEVRDRFERTDLSSSIASSVASSTRKHVSSPVRHPDEVLHGALVKRGDAVRDQPDTPSDQGHGPHTTPLKGKEAGGGGGSQRKGSRSADVSVDEDYRAMAQLGEYAAVAITGSALSSFHCLCSSLRRRVAARSTDHGGHHHHTAEGWLDGLSEPK